MNPELTPSALLKQLHTSLPSANSANKTPVYKFLIAYSGGLDSHVLLHLLSRVSKDEIKCRAVYVNHGLQAEASHWANHCQNICQKLDIAFTSIDLNLEVLKGESTEEVARNARYKALSKSLNENEVLVTAHHQNDQAETLLLQLFRGAGVQGLAAMPELSELKTHPQNNYHVRPLLRYSKSALEAYAKKYELDHIEDPTNKDTAFDRNFLRQDIMPRLRERWLGLDKTISRSASIQAETKTLLDEFAIQLLPSILSNQDYYSLEEMNEYTLAPIDIPKLTEHTKSKQRLLLRYWISHQGFLNPSDQKLEKIFDNLINADEDKQPQIVWRGVELRRFQQRLYIMSPLVEHDTKQEYALSKDSLLEI